MELLAEGGLYAHLYETQFGQKLEVLAGEPAPWPGIGESARSRPRRSPFLAPCASCVDMPPQPCYSRQRGCGAAPLRCLLFAWAGLARLFYVVEVADARTALEAPGSSRPAGSQKAVSTWTPACAIWHLRTHLVYWSRQM